MTQATDLAKSAQQRLEAITLENELYRRAQIALERDHAEACALFEDAPVGMALLERDGTVRRCNRRAQHALGFVLDAGAETNFHDFVCEPSAVEFAEHLSRACGIGHPGSSDLLLRRTDGSSFWARVRSEASGKSAGASTRVLLTIDEIEDSMMDISSQIEAMAGEGMDETATPKMLSGRVMLVDDEELVLNATIRVLHRMGHEIVSYTDPLEALAAFEAAPADYDAVIVDFQMPQMDGLTLCEALLACRPGLAVLLTSAFTGEIDTARAKEIGVGQVLPKPLSAEELAQWLGEAVPDLV
ncbi:MAG: response regulator [bacterium]|nr:response regulator [bacterium]